MMNQFSKLEATLWDKETGYNLLGSYIGPCYVDSSPQHGMSSGW